MINTKKCLICKDGRKNDCLHWHKDKDTGDIWVYCIGKCKRGYSLRSYCFHAGISLPEFLKGDFDFKESRSNEVNKIEFPNWYLTLSDPRAKNGVEYIKSRGLYLEGDMYYDSEKNGIVFPYYFGNTFVGAQTRLINPVKLKDGTLLKIDTIPGTRLGLLFYGWSQSPLMPHIKGIIVVEGALDAVSIKQALNNLYGSVASNPWSVVGVSGSGATKHHKETLKELKEQGYKVIIAPDSDEAGLEMLERFTKVQVLTHYAFTGDDKKDWNDLLAEKGHEEFAKFFLRQVKRV